MAIMQGYETIRKGQAILRLIILVFLGVAIQSSMISAQIWHFRENRTDLLFTPEFFATYLLISFAYSTLTSLYVRPNMVISPYYIQLGTAAVAVFIIALYFAISAEDINVIIGMYVMIGLEFFGFGLYGYIASKVLRKIIGMYGNENSIWTETYRIGTNYESVKRILEDEYFERYEIKDSENNKIIAKRTFSPDIPVLLLLQPDPKSHNETILSMSSCEIKYESMWKTDQSKKTLNIVRRFIDNTIYDYCRVRLIRDEKEETVSSKCVYELLDSLDSPLTKINQIPRKTIFTIGGLLGLGMIVTVLPHIPSIPESLPITSDTIIVTWVTVVSTIIYLSGSEIKSQIKSQIARKSK